VNSIAASGTFFSGSDVGYFSISFSLSFSTKAGARAEFDTSSSPYPLNLGLIEFFGEENLFY